MLGLLEDRIDDAAILPVRGKQAKRQIRGFRPGCAVAAAKHAAVAGYKEISLAIERQRPDAQQRFVVQIADAGIEIEDIEPR
jgi:hypothetical protein